MLNDQIVRKRGISLGVIASPETCGVVGKGKMRPNKHDDNENVARRTRTTQAAMRHAMTLEHMNRSRAERRTQRGIVDLLMWDLFA